MRGEGESHNKLFIMTADCSSHHFFPNHELRSSSTYALHAAGRQPFAPVPSSHAAQSVALDGSYTMLITRNRAGLLVCLAHLITSS